MSTTTELFHELHKSGCFVLPNPWDAGSAVYLHHLGFKAPATPASGFLFSPARAHARRAAARDAALAHGREIAAATPLPVNADFQTGHANEPEREPGRRDRQRFE